MISSVVGAQFGDEGKGRVVDYLSSSQDAVIRYQGGDNAGHTVVNENGKFALHIIPSGIFNQNALNIVSAGCVVNFETMKKELSQIPEKFHSSLLIDSRAHVIFPFHKDLDGAQEKGKSDKDKIGTTKCGIGPCYADKVSRIGLRAGDLLLDEDELYEKIKKLLDRKNVELSTYSLQQYSLEDIMKIALSWKAEFSSKIKDCLPLIKKMVLENKNILLEGQLGVMRDIDWGIYPYCTSSNTTAGAAGSLSGIPLNRIQRIIGVVKAYCSSVGGGPFVTELLDEDGKNLQSIGQEFGATTGRPRRTGWLDGVALNYSAYLNGFTELSITKLDVLDKFKTIKIATAYEVDGKITTELPSTEAQKGAKPVYKEFKGWLCDTSKARKWNDLPVEARNYIKEIEKIVSVPVKSISVGPQRDAIILL